MSTNALVVVPVHGRSDDWKGTYVHWDGDQLHKELVPILKRDGLVETLNTLFAHSWSTLDHETPTQEEIDAAEPKWPDGSPAEIHRYQQDKGFQSPASLVPGYGTTNGEYQESTPDHFVGSPEWVYKIDAGVLFCYSTIETINFQGRSKLALHLRRIITWNDDSTPDLSDLEEEVTS